MLLTTLLLLAVVWVIISHAGVDVSITAANVAPYLKEGMRRGTAGATITRGQVVYFDVSAGTWKLAQHDGTAAESGAGTGSEIGIALQDVASGQPLDIQTEGEIAIGGTLTLGEMYYVSATAGGLAPSADIGTGDYVTAVGVAVTTGRLKLLGTRGISGVQHA